MIQVQEYPTVEASDVTLPVLPRSEDAKAFATFPDFGFVIHPEYLLNGDLNCLERATGQVCAPMVSNLPILKGNFPNGAIAFDLQALRDVHGVSFNQVALKPSKVNPNEFSYAVASLRTGDLGSTSVFHHIRDSAQIIEGYPRIIFRAGSGLIALYNGSTMLVSEPSNSGVSGIVQIYMVTYNSVDGGKVYRNGELIASSPDVATWNAAAGLNAMFAAGTAAFGLTTVYLKSAPYLTTIDLSKPEHATKRAAITDYLTRTYKS